MKRKYTNNNIIIYFLMTLNPLCLKDNAQPRPLLELETRLDGVLLVGRMGLLRSLFIGKPTASKLLFKSKKKQQPLIAAWVEVCTY